MSDSTLNENLGNTHCSANLLNEDRCEKVVRICKIQGGLDILLRKIPSFFFQKYFFHHDFFLTSRCLIFQTRYFTLDKIKPCKTGKDYVQNHWILQNLTTFSQRSSNGATNFGSHFLSINCFHAEVFL